MLPTVHYIALSVTTYFLRIMHSSNRHIRLILSVLLISYACTATAQEPACIKFGMDDGLPSQIIYSTMQDRDGYIWICTANGVSRYDGFHFQNFSLKDGLCDVENFYAVEDSSGRVWFDSFNGKICYWENGTIHKIDEKLLPPDILVTDERPRYLPDLKGNMCIIKNGILVKVMKDFDMTVLNYKKGDKIFLNTHVDGKNMWISTKGMYEEKDNKLTLIKEWEEGYCLNAISNKGNNFLIFQNNHTIYNLEYVTPVKYHTITTKEVLQKPLVHFGAATDSSLYVVVYGNGLLKLNLQNHQEELLFRNIEVFNTAIDREGITWISTPSNGLYLILSKPAFAINEKDGIASNDATALAYYDNKLFVGYYNGSVQELKSKQTVMQPVPNRTHQKIRNLTTLNGKLCSCQESGFREYHNGIERKLASNCKAAIYYDGFYYVATVGNLYIINAETGVIETPFTGRVHSLIATSEGAVLFYTFEGLMQYKDGKITPFELTGHDKTLRLGDMVKTKNGTILFASHGAGVLMLRNNEVEQIDEAQGLVSDLVNRVKIDDQDRIWVCTNKGLDMVELQDEYPFYKYIRHFDSGSGLSSDYVRDAVCLRDTVWAATDAGVTYFPLYPVETTKAQILFKSVTTRDSVYTTEVPLHLAYDNNSIVFNYTCISFSNIGNTTFYYRLMPTDTAWQHTNATTISYLSLQPGQYTFEIKPVLNGVVSTTDLHQYYFSIGKPLYKHAWFILLIIGAALAIFSVIYIKLRDFYIKRSNRIQHLNALEKNALVAQMNPHFMFNALNSVNDFIADNEPKNAHNFLSKFARLMRITLDNSRKELVTLEEEIQSLKSYIELEQMRFVDKFDLDLRIQEILKVDQCKIPPMMIQPFVENAILHGILETNRKCVLILDFFMINHKQLCVRIEDNGAGRKEMKTKNKHNSHASNITNERIKLMNEGTVRGYTFSITDLKNNDGSKAGTRVDLTFPIQK